MKPIRNILLTALLTIVGFSSLIYTACHKDKCVNMTCLNLGRCDNGICTCPAGFEGLRCDTLSRNKFIYRFNGGDSCHVPVKFSQYHITFVTNTAKPTEMVMKNFLNNQDDSAFCTIWATDSFSFEGSNNSTTYNGIGKLYHDTLKMHYNVYFDTTNYSCVYTGGR